MRMTHGYSTCRRTTYCCGTLKIATKVRDPMDYSMPLFNPVRS